MTVRKNAMVIIAAALLLVARTSAAGTVTRVSVAPEKVAAGGTVTITVSGTNPCGAAHIIYGDGEAVTYAITGLPYAQTHVYSKAGTYTITGKGMGNCDGEVTTTVTVTAPPPAPPKAPEPPQAPPSATQITAVEMAPNPGRVGEPITIAVKGRGTCTYEVHFGDGNAQEVTGELPQLFRHTYAKPDSYTVIVKPTPPCTGRFTQVLQIVATEPQQARINRVLTSPSPVDAGQPVDITVEGSGTCRYTIEFGDGNDESRSEALPDRLRHVYPAAGAYKVVARASPPCTGAASAPVDVRGRQ
jgi:hypothetical protein